MRRGSEEGGGREEGREGGREREESKKRLVCMLPEYTVLLTVCYIQAISMGELYGEVNKLTLEWRDGLMATIVRECVKDTTEDHKWIVCDGPVDALWIENMNTVLDDNKMLCLANSERIKLNPTMHMMFEVQDLAVASPATVSR